MKWMIASDLHGSAYYCKKMVEAFEREGADRLLMLGDLLYHGPRNDLPRDYAPKEVIPMLNGLKNKLCCVRGNCEAEVDQMVLDFRCWRITASSRRAKSSFMPPTGISIMERTRRRWPKGTSCSTATLMSRRGRSSGRETSASTPAP